MEKYEALSIEDLGKDLRSVQALQRKHEGLERDLAALGERIDNLEEGGEKLAKNHPEAAQDIADRKAEILKDWVQLKQVATERKEKLLDSYDFQVSTIVASLWVKGLQNYQRSKLLVL